MENHDSNGQVDSNRMMRDTVSQIKAHVIYHLNQVEHFGLNELETQTIIRSLVAELVVLENVPKDMTYGDLINNHWQKKLSRDEIIITAFEIVDENDI